MFISDKFTGTADASGQGPYEENNRFKGVGAWGKIEEEIEDTKRIIIGLRLRGMKL